MSMRRQPFRVDIDKEGTKDFNQQVMHPVIAFSISSGKASAMARGLIRIPII